MFSQDIIHKDVFNMNTMPFKRLSILSMKSALIVCVYMQLQDTTSWNNQSNPKLYIYINMYIYKHVSYLDFALITRQVYVNKHGCIELGWDTRRNADDSPRT